MLCRAGHRPVFQASSRRAAGRSFRPTKKLKLGVADRRCRRAAQAPDDFRRPVARPPASRKSFDTYVDAAVKRFQARHGLPADGVLGKYTYAAMNVSAQVRLGQLETNLVRLRSMSGFLGDALRDGQHSGRADRGRRERHASCCATPRSSARSTARRRSSIPRSTRSSSIPTGTRRNRSSTRTSSR